MNLTGRFREVGETLSLDKHTNLLAEDIIEIDDSSEEQKEEKFVSELFKVADEGTVERTATFLKENPILINDFVSRCNIGKIFNFFAAVYRSSRMKVNLPD